MNNLKCFKQQLLLMSFLISTVLLFGINSATARMGGADYFPNLPLVNTEGKVLHFYDDVIKGKVVAINFMFTGCEDSCPLETAKLRHVEQLLGEHAGKNVHMYSISVDPENDTPAVLKAYKKKFQIGPAWEFLTGKKEDIDKIRKKLGMYSTEGEETELSAHAITFILGNEAKRQWLKRSPFDLPETIVVTLLGRLQSRPLNLASGTSYAESRITRSKEGELKGMELFNSRCASCHTFGEGDRLGPDLLGVASKRDPAWLARWLQEPDVMLREKDPRATALYMKYNQVQMPNVRLTREDTKALIQYMHERSRIVMKKRELAKNTNQAKAEDHHQAGGHDKNHTH